MEKKLILDHQLVDITMSRLAQEVIENHQDFQNSVILGLQPRGVFVAQRIHARLEAWTGKKIPIGSLDATFYRDDFRRRDGPIKPNATDIPFIIEDKQVILMDDVLFTGRTARAALDAMIAFGRPSKVELLVLINRRYWRHFPIEPNYVGKELHTMSFQRVEVEWKDQGFEHNRVWIGHQAGTDQATAP